MGFFEDVGNALLAPVKAVGGFFGDVFSGKNFFESLGKLGGNLISSTLAVPAAVVSFDPIENFLGNFGDLGKGLGSGAQYFTDVNTGKKDIDWVGFRDASVPFLATGVGVLGATLAAPTLAAGVGATPIVGSSFAAPFVSTGLAAGAGYGIAQSAYKGDLGVIASVLPGLGLPPPPKEVQDAAGAIYDAVKPKNDAPQVAGPPVITQSGYSSNIPGGDWPGKSVSLMPLIVVGGIVAYAALGRKS